MRTWASIQSASFCVQVASGVGVIGGAKHGDEDLRFTHDPGCAIDDHDFLAGVIDKYLVAGRMVLPHGRRQPPLELPEQIAEATVAIASRVNRAILLRKHHQIDARPLKFAGERAPIWLGAPAVPTLDAGMGEQTLFKNASVRSPAKGHASPAAAARLRLSWIVLRATPSVRPISRALTPSRASRSIWRICRMGSSLLAGIRFPPLINEGLDA